VKARAWLVFALVALLAACAGAVRFQPETPGYYTVRKSDTLYSIAFRNELNWRELAYWNDIDPPYTLTIGQQLRLTSPATGPQVVAAPGAAPPPPGKKRAPPPLPSGPPSKLGWGWPADGRITAVFNAANPTGKGVDIAGTFGADVRAASDGRVVYVGSGLVGYGKVIIVKHDDRYLSAYAHNDDFLVHEGEAVKRGQRIAMMGLGPGQRPMLHFEIRLDGRAIDPQRLLPAR
jgi:lipoprotein NlpD